MRMFVFGMFMLCWVVILLMFRAEGGVGTDV